MKVLDEVKTQQFDLALYDHFVERLAEFLSIPRSEVGARLKMGIQEPGKSIAQDWRQASPQTADDVTKFYQDTHSYLYDLAADHCLSHRPPVWEATVKRIERRGSGQDVLLYGDGIGSDSISLARLGHRVTYFDLPGKTSEFARFRFFKDGLQDQITVITDLNEIPAGRFDGVVCIEVLEHVPDPPATMQNLFNTLKSRGIALITESFESVGPDFPSHLPENLKYAGQTHQLMERLGFANTYYNSDPLNRPMEFTKIELNLPGRLLRLEGRLRRAIHTRWRYITHRSDAAQLGSVPDTTG